MAKHCSTKLLDDIPAKDDFFDSHGRVALAIQNLVLKEGGGKAIALTGSWGSGKSTVVRLLADSFEKNIIKGSSTDKKNDNILTFIFDAWSHQGDPLRRVFLERFIGFLIARNWIKDQLWKTELEKLSRRRQDTDSRSTPLITNLGKVIILTLLLLPLGYALFSQIGKPETFLWMHLMWWGLIIALLPVMVPTFAYVRSRPSWRFWSLKSWAQIFTKAFWKYNEDSFFHLFINKTREIVETTTIQTIDPTSIEFQGLFTKAVQEALTNSQRKLLIVIDNLDRIDPKEALSIWSTMRTFFEDTSKDDARWFDRFWLLVPYDPGALKRLWPHENEDDLVSSFIEKTFQAEFRVAPPVPSDWEGFFRQQLAGAFPGHNKDDFDTVYRLFHLKRVSDRLRITPRDIKIFINRVGSLHRQWEDEIPLPMQALYTLFSGKNDKSDKKSGEFPELTEGIANLIAGIEWQKFFAALHFNVTPEKAIQVYIGEKIEQALLEGNLDVLAPLRSLPGFQSICENFVDVNSRTWSKKGQASLADVSLNIDALEKQEPSLDWTKTRKYIHKAALEIETWPRLTDRIGEGIASILRHTTADDFQKLSSSLLESLSKPTAEMQEKQGNLDAEAVRQWTAGAKQVVKTIQDAGGTEILLKCFKVPGNGSFFIQTLLNLHQINFQDLIPFFVPTVGRGDIITEFAKICAEGKISEPHVNLTRSLINFEGSWTWDQIVSALRGRFQVGNAIAHTEIPGIVGILLHLFYEKQDQGALSEFAHSGVILHHLHSCTNVPGAAALCILALIDQEKSVTQPQAVGNSAHGFTFYRQFLQNPSAQQDLIPPLAGAVVAFGRVPSMLTYASADAGRRAAINEIMKVIANRSDAHKYFQPAIIVAHFAQLKELLGEELLRALIHNVATNTDLPKHLTTGVFSEGLGQLYLLVYQETKATPIKEYVDFLLSEIQSFQKETWLSEIRKEGYLLELSFALIESGTIPQFTIRLQDALLEHAQQMLNGLAAPSRLFDRWPLFLNALAEDMRQTLLRSLRDELIKEQAKPYVSVLKLYGSSLIKSNILEEKSDDVVRLLFTAIVKRRDPSELMWLKNALQENQNLVAAAEEDSVKNFGKRLSSILKENGAVPNDVKKLIFEISPLLGSNFEDPIEEIHEPSSESESTS